MVGRNIISGAVVFHPPHKGVCFVVHNSSNTAPTGNAKETVRLSPQENVMCVWPSLAPGREQLQLCFGVSWKKKAKQKGEQRSSSKSPLGGRGLASGQKVAHRGVREASPTAFWMMIYLSLARSLLCPDLGCGAQIHTQRTNRLL